MCLTDVKKIENKSDTTITLWKLFMKLSERQKTQEYMLRTEKLLRGWNIPFRDYFEIGENVWNIDTANQHCPQHHGFCCFRNKENAIAYNKHHQITAYDVYCMPVKVKRKDIIASAKAEYCLYDDVKAVMVQRFVKAVMVEKFVVEKPTIQFRIQKNNK